MPSKQAIAAQDNATYTTSSGAPVAEPYAIQRIGLNGPVLIQGIRFNIIVLFAVLFNATFKTSTTSTF